MRVMTRELYIAGQLSRAGVDDREVETCAKDSPLEPLRFAAEEVRIASDAHAGYLSSISAALRVEVDRHEDFDAPGDCLAPLCARADEWAASLRSARQRLERTVDAMLAGQLTA